MSEKPLHELTFDLMKSMETYIDMLGSELKVTQAIAKHYGWQTKNTKMLLRQRDEVVRKHNELKAHLLANANPLP
jgi:hypothetical protein